MYPQLLLIFDASIFSIGMMDFGFVASAYMWFPTTHSWCVGSATWMGGGGIQRGRCPLSVTLYPPFVSGQSYSSIFPALISSLKECFKFEIIVMSSSATIWLTLK